MSERWKDCEDYWNLLSARMDGELAEDERHALEAHLAVCGACRSVDEGFRLDDADLRRGAAPRRAAAARLGERVAGRVAGAGRRRGAGSWLLAGLAAAAGFAAACVVFRPWQREGASPPTLVTTPVAVPAPPSRLAARLALATGRVEMLAPGRSDWIAVPTGGDLEAGTRLRTGTDVLCELAGLDGSSVRLNADSELLVSDRRRFDLARGRMWSHVERDPTPFEVLAAGATITALGTKFDVHLDGATAELMVIEGVTRVAGAEGKAELVRTGELATFEAGVLRERSLAYDVVFATRWMNRLLVLREDSPELTARLEELLAKVGEAKVESLAEEELLELGDSCVRPLLSYLQSERARSRAHEARRHKAAEVIEKLAPRWAVKDLIDLLAYPSGTVRAAAARTLLRLTGETQGVTPNGWRNDPWTQHEVAYGRWLDWWKAHAGEYAVKK
jgi:ferric-dicitrate binding protein FerR (iron transport regulator)